MFVLSFFLVLALALVGLLKFVSYFISERSILNREELTSYECGFEHHNVSRLPFSFRYFFLTLVFLLFDLEIVFLVFFVGFIFSNFVIVGVVVLVFFLVGLFAGLALE